MSEGEIDSIIGCVRSTALSAASMVFALTAAVTRLFGGVVADLTSPTVMLGAFGMVFISGGLVVFAWESPVPATTSLSSE